MVVDRHCLLLSYDDAPKFLKSNPYIRSGYRADLPLMHCIKSLFWWTNETLNIWTHIVGSFIFLVLPVYDLFVEARVKNATSADYLILGTLTVCFQICFIMSSCFHLFCCQSESAYQRWLVLDQLGVALSLLGIFLSGIYYAFSCFTFWMEFYVGTVILFFVAIATAFISYNRDDDKDESKYQRIVMLFVAWAAYGIIPTAHWAITSTWSHPMVNNFVPKVIQMYLIVLAAFFFYITKFPEKILPGKLDFIGHSHQLWHILVIVAFYHWHNAGIEHLDMRAQYGCNYLVL